LSFERHEHPPTLGKEVGVLIAKISLRIWINLEITTRRSLLIYYCKAVADRLADTRVNRLQELQSCGAHQLRNRGARVRTNFLLSNEGKIFVARPNKRVNTM
jgi:hypothetical protein